jgi:hypothetical protein
VPENIRFYYVSSCLCLHQNSALTVHTSKLCVLHLRCIKDCFIISHNIATNELERIRKAKLVPDLMCCLHIRLDGLRVIFTLKIVHLSQMYL